MRKTNFPERLFPIQWFNDLHGGSVEICRINEDKTTDYNWEEIERIAEQGEIYETGVYIDKRIAMLLLPLKPKGANGQEPAGICSVCRLPVFHRSGYPGEVDHDWRMHDEIVTRKEKAQ